MVGVFFYEFLVFAYFFKKGDMEKTILIFLFLFSFSSLLAGPHPKDFKDDDSIQSLQREAKKIKSKVKSLESKISSLEKQLGGRNDQYLKVIEKKKKLDELIFSYTVDLKQYREKLERKEKKTKKYLSSLVLNRLKKSESSDILKRKVLKKHLEKVIEEKRNLSVQVKKRANEVDILKKRLDEYMNVERNLFELLQRMESKKKTIAQKYLKNRDIKNEMIKKLESMKIKRLKNIEKKKGISQTFYSPIKFYNSDKFEKKGITYYFSKSQSVKSVASGEISYVGDLSTYGNVIMVNHGDDTRSVLLGEFNPQVKKGLKVNKGHTLAKTEENYDGKLYFEVRKKNQVQNTVLLMNDDFLAKNNIIL